MEKRVLITGIAGFIGFHFAKKMMGLGIPVVGLDNINDYYSVQLKRDRLKELGIDTDGGENEPITSTKGDLVFIKGKLEDEEVWENLGKAYTITDIIHLAAQAGVRYSLEAPRSYIASNVSGFINVLEFCRQQGIDKLIYASSSSVYGLDSDQPFSEGERCDKPVSLYAATKRTNEMMAYTYHHLFGIKSMGLRFFTVYGPWGRPDMAPMLFARAAYEGNEIKVFNHGNQSRDFTFIDDIVEGIYNVYKHQEEVLTQADVCNIGNGSPVELMTFISAIEKTTQRTLKKEFVEAQPGDVKVTFADTAKLKTEIHYEPKVGIHEGVQRFIDWYKDYYEVQ